MTAMMNTFLIVVLVSCKQTSQTSGSAKAVGTPPRASAVIGSSEAPKAIAEQVKKIYTSY